MVTFTEAAREMVRAFIEQGIVKEPALRIAAREGDSPLAPRFEFTLVEVTEQTDDDLVVDADGFTVLLDIESAAAVDGCVVDYVEANGESGFQVRSAMPTRPVTATTPDEQELAQRISALLEDRINPAVAAHGGRISLVAVRGTTALIEMSGGCQGCGMARVTLRQGVERMIRESIPEVTEVQDVTDHRSGTNPYYRPYA